MELITEQMAKRIESANRKLKDKATAHRTALEKALYLGLIEMKTLRGKGHPEVLASQTAQMIVACHQVAEGLPPELIRKSLEESIRRLECYVRRDG